MSQEVFNVTVIRSGTSAAGTANYIAFWAPTDALGGGVTITKVAYSSPLAVNVASAAQPELVTLGTNSAINGTIAPALGSVAWTAGTIRSGTITNAFVDAGYGVAVKWAQPTSANNDENVYIANIQYVMGR